MQLIFLLLILLLFLVLKPLLLPFLAIIAGIALFANIRRMIAAGRFTQEKSSSGRKIEYTDSEGTGPFHRNEEVEAPDIMLERPASVMDDEFWEKDHTVYDVPFEEADSENNNDRE